MKKTVSIALIQTVCSERKEENLNRVAEKIKEAASIGADIVCLQELFNYSYFAREPKKDFHWIAESIPGQTSNFLIEQARKCQINIVGGSFYEKGDNGQYYNTTLIINRRGDIVGKYRKMHIPHDPNYYEQDYFSPGDLGFIVADLDGIKVAPLICYDQWFPEAARIVTLKGAQIIFYPTAIGFFDELKKAEPFSAQRWEDAMRSHASLNGVYVAAVNRGGSEGDIEFWGGSFIADPFGQLVSKANSRDEEIVFATVDLDKIFESQDGWGFLRNRRTDSYGGLLEKSLDK
jgi:N-carbamoylputrescine amidase